MMDSSFFLFFGRIPLLDYILIILILALIYLIFDYLVNNGKQGNKLEEEENTNLSESKKVIETLQPNQIKMACMSCHHIWIPITKKGYQTQWYNCPKCNQLSSRDDFENEYVKKEKEKMVDGKYPAAEMSIEALQELINAKKLEASKPAAEMSIEELQSVIKLKTSEKMEPIKKPTDALYIVAIFLGIIGGLIGYILAKDDDPKMANNLLIVGIATSIIGLFLYFVFIASLF
jgi:Ca2+/Na+ antiporter